MSRDDFIEKAKKIHGDKYDYSPIPTTMRVRDKVKIVCPEHGIFEQQVRVHLSDSGCSRCGTRLSNNVKFIEKAKKIHGDKYDYSLVEYCGSHKKVKIICSEHGVFEQTPTGHLSGKGCVKCGGNKKSNTIEFIKKAKEIHGDRYDYSLVEYVNNKTKVKIICPIHGEFEQSPGNHLSGKGCSICGLKRITYDKSMFIKKAKEIHGDRYDYSLVEYVNSKTKVKIICPEHGVFKTTPEIHYIVGSVCPMCNLQNQTKPKEVFINE